MSLFSMVPSSVLSGSRSGVIFEKTSVAHQMPDKIVPTERFDSAAPAFKIYFCRFMRDKVLKSKKSRERSGWSFATNIKDSNTTRTTIWHQALSAYGRPVEEFVKTASNLKI